MDYRIKEQFGIFVVEKKVCKTEELPTVLSLLFPRLFKPKKKESSFWVEINKKGESKSFLVEPAKFKTIDLAKKFFETLKPKYYYWENLSPLNLDFYSNK